MGAYSDRAKWAHLKPDRDAQTQSTGVVRSTRSRPGCEPNDPQLVYYAQSGHDSALATHVGDHTYSKRTHPHHVGCMMHRSVTKDHIFTPHILPPSKRWSSVAPEQHSPPSRQACTSMSERLFPILPHGAMAPATTYIFKGQGSASHPAWAWQAAKTVKFRV